MEIRSKAFRHEGTIPQEYTCDGSNYSPPIEWRQVPEKAQSMVVIARDPDSPRGNFTHWIIYDVPPRMGGLQENLPMGGSLFNGARQGQNDFGKIGYGGPCPRHGTHRYFFEVFALDQPVGLPGGATEEEVRQAMAGHVIAQGELMGRYRKQG